MVGIQLYESIQNIDFNEDGTINRDTLKFGMSDSLFRGMNIEELYEILIEKIIDFSDKNPDWPYKVDKNLHSWNSDKYPYGKAFSRNPMPASTDYIGFNGLYVEFDKNELSKIRGTIFRNTNYSGHYGIKSYRDFDSASSYGFLAETLLLSQKEIVSIENLDIKKLIKKVNIFIHEAKEFINFRDRSVSRSRKNNEEDYMKVIFGDILGYDDNDEEISNEEGPMKQKFREIISTLKTYGIPFYVNRGDRPIYYGANSFLSKDNIKNPSEELIDDMYND